MKKLSWTETLGNTPDEIANNIYKMGVRGIPRDCRNCIIARVYKHLFPDGWSNIFVKYGSYFNSKKEIVYYGKISFNDCQIMDPPCPRVLAEFMFRFDKGKYPFLEANKLPNKEDIIKKLTHEERIVLGY